MKLFQDQTGQALVEAALIIPILLFLLMGMFIVGYWLNAIQVATAAAREGARAASLTGDACKIGAAVADTMRIIDTKHYEIGVDPLPLPGRGSPITVQVVYQIPFGFQFFKSEYARINATASYPFSVAVGQATARMEVDAASPQPSCP